VREPHRQCAAYSPPMAGFSTGQRPCRNLPNSSSTPGQTSGDGSVGGGGGWAGGAGGGSGGGSGSGGGGAGGRSGGGSGSRGRRWRRWWRRWPRAATSADATSAHRSTSDPPAPLPVGLMAPDEITPAHTLVIIGARQQRRCRARGPSNLRRRSFRQIERRRLFKTDQSATRTDRVRRGDGRLLHRLRPQQAGARLRLFRGRAGAARGGQAPHPRRGAARCYQCC
jgi:hypothetical protein